MKHTGKKWALLTALVLALLLVSAMTMTAMADDTEYGILSAPRG